MHQRRNQFGADVMLLSIHAKLIGVGHQSRPALALSTGDCSPNNTSKIAEEPNNEQEVAQLA